MVAWKDLREYLSQAKKLGELKVIKGADPKMEVSAIAQINGRHFGPALLFEDSKGYEGTGFKVLTNSMGNVKLFNLAIGGDTGNGIKETIESLRGKPNKWAEDASNYPVQFVEDSPLRENVETGDKINLMKFPTPLWHELDGGRFIGTGVSVITEDPETKQINCGAYRAQLYEKNMVGINIGVGKHGSFHIRKYFDKGQRMPIVLVIGPDPLSYMLAGSEVPTGISELEYQGAIMGERMKVIKGRATGLPIPADAEIALEGFVYPGKTRVEGPHGEWPGYYASIPQEKPYVEIETVYHRNEPTLVGAAMSKGASNDHAFWRSIWKSALIYDEIVKNGLPGVKGVYVPPFGVGRQFLNISIKQSYPGHATEAGYLASQTRGAAYMGKWVVVVDDDVNPYDMNDVLWAMCSRADPQEIGIIKNAWGWNNWGVRVNSRGIIFAVTPYEKLKDTTVSGKTCFINEEMWNSTYKKWHKELDGRWEKD